jgi:hypothetical protein
MSKSLLEIFSSLDQSTKDILADIESPLLLSFAALEIANDKCAVEKLSSEYITACLESAGVAVSKISISKALARAKNRVSAAKNEDGETFYKLMTKGKREIADVLGGESMSIVRIEGNQPRTARIRLGEVLSKLRGEVRICDPYYGIRTFDSLDYIPNKCRVRFLTMKTNETGRKLSGALRDFKKEKSNVEFRLVASPQDLHDRYVVNKDILLLLGHGLKDIGGKESFMIRLNKELIPDLIIEVTKTFDAHWNTATPI